MTDKLIEQLREVVERRKKAAPDLWKASPTDGMLDCGCIRGAEFDDGDDALYAEAAANIDFPTLLERLEAAERVIEWYGNDLWYRSGEMDISGLRKFIEIDNGDKAREYLAKYKGE